MPTAINPNNYNIDFFQSYSFGEITDGNYLNYLFNQNLQEIAPELVNSPAGNFTSKYEEKGSEKSINYGPISNSGSIDEWALEGNFSVNLFDISYQNPSQNVGTNQYGPASLEAFNYENTQLIVEDTGYIQYPTSTGGNIVTTLLSEGLDAVGISSTNFIDFDSPLNDIAKKRRLEEAKNRIKDGIIENTIGRINLDPLGLLAGQPLFGKDYTITKPAGGILGGIINFASDVAGVNTQALSSLFGGPLPKGALDWDSPLEDPFSINTIDISEKLLNRTGKGTKNLLFKALAINKYGPVIEGQNQPINTQPKAEDSNQKTQKAGYLAYGEIIRTREQEEKKSAQQGFNGLLNDLTFNDSPFTDKLGTRPPISFNTANKSAKDITGNLPSTDGVTTKSKQRNSRPDVPIEPSESENPSLTLKTTDALKFQGFEFEPNGAEYDPTYDSFKGGWDFGHNSNWGSQFTSPKQVTAYNPERVPGSEEGNDGPEPGPQVWNGELFWKDGRTEGLPKRGLLNYTQKLINKSTNVNGTAARFIGLPNSDQNYDAQSGDRRHITMSQGNLVKETKENKYYCRSWSVRNAYNTYNDLIRNDALWRDTQPGTLAKGEKETNNRKLGSYSTLREPGIPKIAWERDGVIENEIIRNKINGLSKVNIGPKHIIPYMFSIENLAWKDSPHQRKLPLCEQGPHGGRIMWFPPYNINFTDNTSINWDTTTFIGRGEPIYTYNHTERTGTLSFTIIVDHPSIVNKLKEGAFSTTTIDESGNEVKVSGSQNLETFFAGCSTEEIKTIVKEAFKEIIPPDVLNTPEPEEIKPNEFEKESAPEINDVLSFHFKNATRSGLKENKEDKSKYANQSIITNSSCPDGIVGRCFDYNYERASVDWYDNPRLYKGGSNNFGGNGECQQGNNIIIEGYDINDLVIIPLGGTFSTPVIPPCNGSNTQPWGPKASATKNKRWSDNGKGYKNENYCCPITFTGYTSGSTTITQLNRLGFYGERSGANQRFWGTGSYPYDNGTNQKGKGPVLELPFTPEGGWKLEVVSDAPSTGGPGTGINQLMEFLTTTALGKEYTINVVGHCSNAADGSYNEKLGQDRADAVYNWMKKQMNDFQQYGVPQIDIEGIEKIDLFSDAEIDKDSQKCSRWNVSTKGKADAVSTGIPGNDSALSAAGEFTLTPSALHPVDYQNEGQLAYRRVDVYLTPNASDCVKEYYDKAKKLEQERVNGLNEDQKKLIEKQKNEAVAEQEKERQKAIELAKSFVNECDYFEAIKKEDSFLYESIKDKLKNFHPAFHSITPEGFNERITFLQQCTRQGPSFIDPEQPQNTAFGRPPVCILRLGDFYFTRIIIDSINFTFDPLQWDLNPEGIGVQPMLVNVDLNFKFIGGSTLQGPLTQLQNAVSYNFFANTAIYKPIEKIITTRGSAGEILIQGDAGFDDGRNKKTYYYGPWASPTDFTDSFPKEEANAQTTEGDTSKTLDETLKDDLIEDKPFTPCEGGRKITAEEVVNLPSLNDFYTQWVIDFPETSYDYYLCDEESGDLRAIPKEESNPLNAVDGDDKTKTEQNLQQENTTTKDTAQSPFFEKNPNFNLTNENKFGKLIYSGVIRNNSAGEGTFFEGGFNLLGLIPKYVYAMLKSNFTSDGWYTTNTLDSNSSGSNNAYVYNGNDGKSTKYSCCQLNSSSNLPTREAAEEIVAFNFLNTLTGYDTLKEWKDEFKNGDDFFMEDLLSEIQNKGQFKRSFKYNIQLNKKDSAEVVNDVIVINLIITADGYYELEKTLKK
jgi:hypothetical protein